MGKIKSIRMPSPLKLTMGPKRPFLTATLFISIFQSVKAALPQATQEGILRPFKSYADVTLFHYYVPPEANVATFEFAAFMDNPKCAVREAFIYIQQGSYPVMNNNATFPNNFWVNRTSLHKLVVRSTYNTHDASVLPIYNPLPGNWFAAAFLNTWDQKVQQEGLGHKCQYSLGSVGLWSLNLDVNTIPLKSTMRYTSSKHFTYYKFYVPSGVVQFSVEISGCRFLTSRFFRDSVENYNTSNPCIHNIFIRDRALPFYSKKSQQNTSDFTFLEKLPRTDVYYYLLVVAGSRVSYDVKISVEECPVITLNKSLIQQFSLLNQSSLLSSSEDQIIKVNMSMISNTNPNGNGTLDNYKTVTHISEIPPSPHNQEDGNRSCPCVPTFRLTRIRHAQDFSDTFLLEGKEWYTSWLALTESNPFSPNGVIGTSFELLPFIDIGGTLSISVRLDDLILNATKQSVHVDICVLQGKRPRTYCCDEGNNGSSPAPSLSSCCDGVGLTVSTLNSSEMEANVKIPFPEADTYFMSFKMHCEFGGSLVPCTLPEALIALDIRTQPCVMSSRVPGAAKGSPPVSACGAYGYCQEVHKGQYFYTACRCVAGYKGWACNDDSEAIPKSVLLWTTLLLTLSNAAFIPAVLLALKRRMWVQGFIYFSTMVSSTLYHACDQEIYSYCLTRYSVLQFCDFFCSILSFWVTIIAISSSPPEFDSVLYILGSLLIAVGVEYNRTGLLVFILPFSLGGAWILAVWLYRSVRRGSVLLPKVSRVLIFIPGLLLGASGLILFAFVETEDNYRYTHSAWHTIIAISLLYLLPKRRSVKIIITNATANGSSAAEMSHVNTISANTICTNADTDPNPPPVLISGGLPLSSSASSSSPVFFVTSDLDHLVQRPQ